MCRFVFIIIVPFILTNKLNYMKRSDLQIQITIEIFLKSEIIFSSLQNSMYFYFENMSKFLLNPMFSSIFQFDSLKYMLL